MYPLIHADSYGSNMYNIPVCSLLPTDDKSLSHVRDW